MNYRTPLFIANWKMNKYLRETPEFVERLRAGLSQSGAQSGADSLGAGSSGGPQYEVALCASATHLTTLARTLAPTPFRLGAQNCGTAKFGAYTGEISPAVLKEIGCEWVLVGHSERRHLFKEEDSLILARLTAALEEGLKVVLCVGEVLQDRKVGKTFKVVETQLSILKQGQLTGPLWDRVVIAYEPVWAIGTGENASPQQAQEVHAFIRGWLAERSSSDEATRMRILYGGSAKPENASQLMAQKDVDGLLVGTASLDPAGFAGLIKNGLPLQKYGQV